MKTKLLAMSADVTITAAEADKPDGPKKFEVTAYTGGPIKLRGFDMPVVVEMSGMKFGKSIVANLDHNPSQRVGHVTAKTKDGGNLLLGGIASAATAARDEVVRSAADGFVWQASIEASIDKIVEVADGQQIVANGQTMTGPLYHVKKSTLKGFAFVSHGADDNTEVTIAASAASTKEKAMKPEVKAWAEKMGIDTENMTEDQQANIEANYEGRTTKPAKRPKFQEGIDAKLAEAERVEAITEIALNACDKRPYDIEAIKALGEQAIESKWTVEKFRLELLEASLPPAHTVFRTRKDERLNSKVIEAAICVTGRLPGHEKMFDDQTLQAAHDRFKNGIGLKQLLLMAAEANGHRASYSSDITLDVQRAAFGLRGPQPMGIQAQGWSTIEISSILSNSANKFLRDGWNAVDMTPMRIASIRSVRDFKTITTVSLVGDVQLEKLGAAGEIKHGTLGEVVYTGKADTYAKMLAITRTDLVNDDLGALTTVPRRLGRGAGLKLNDIFWTAFLYGETSGFFSATHTGPPVGNANLNTGVADVSTGGLAATETMFMSQIDPDGKPIGIEPAIILVPTALKVAALTLMNSQFLIDGTATGTQGSANVFQGRWRVESSPYMHNTSYTGYSASKWYLLADPNVMPVIEIQALNGRVEPTVDTAESDFNTLGIQMRCYSDIGCSLQEYRAGVKADGTT